MTEFQLPPVPLISQDEIKLRGAGKNVVYVYLRNSSTMLDSASQLNDITRFIDECKTPIIPRSQCVIILDDAVSGVVHQSLRKLGDVIERSRYDDIFLCGDLSRVGRDPPETVAMVTNLLNKSVKVYSVKETSWFEAGSDGHMKLFMYSLFAGAERTKHITRVLAGIKTWGPQGMIRPKPPFGWVRISKEQPLMPDEKQQETITLVKTMQAEGKSMTAIAKYLNETGRNALLITKHKKDGSNPVRKFSAQTIKNILINEGILADTRKPDPSRPLLRFTPIIIERMVALYREKKSVADIARSLNKDNECNRPGSEYLNEMKRLYPQQVKHALTDLGIIAPIRKSRAQRLTSNRYKKDIST